MEGAPVLEPLEHSVLEIALDGGLIKDWSVLEPLEHSVLEKASDVRPKWVRIVLEPLEHSVPDVAPVWGDYSLIKRTVLDPLGVTGSVDLLSRSDVKFGTVKAFGSEYTPGRWTYRRLVSFRTVRAFGSGGSLGRSAQAGSNRFGTVGAFGSGCCPSQG